MLSEDDLGRIRAKMQAEHEKDRQALERLMRFLPDGGKASLLAIGDPNLKLLATRKGSILEGVELVFENYRDRTWTSGQIRAEIESRGYELKAVSPMATIGVALTKLVAREKIEVVRRGSGRDPHIYQWKADKKKKEKDEPTDRR